MDIINIYNVLKKIETTSSKNAKESILKENEGNKDILTSLDFLLNPYIVTGISAKKMSKKIEAKGDTPVIRTLDELIEYLKDNNSGRDIDILAVRNYADQFESIELHQFILKFVTKDLKLGISEKTVNKVYGKDTIPTFAVMLAESFEKKGNKVNGKFYITLKLDGNRCMAIKENGKTKFFSRKGQEIAGLTQLEEDFESFPDNQVYDGELLLINKDNLPSDELFRLTQKVVRKDGEKNDLLFNMFDSLPIMEFKAGKSKRTYEQRRNTINLFSDTKFIKILPVLYEGDDKSVISAFASVVEAQGFEGLMINTANGFYQTKRVTDLLKVKSFKSADLLCMGLEEGTGRNEGRLGAILVEYKGGVTKIGTGFSDEQRDYFWNNKDEITGKIIETKFFEESMDEKTKQVSLRFPVFVCVRLDKGVDDIRYE